MGTAVRDTKSSQEGHLGTAVGINLKHYIITRGALGNTMKRHYIITSAAVRKNGKNKTGSLYHHKRSSWERRCE